jgi:hypothetical protein
MLPPIEDLAGLSLQTLSEGRQRGHYRLVEHFDRVCRGEPRSRKERRDMKRLIVTAILSVLVPPVSAGFAHDLMPRQTKGPFTLEKLTNNIGIVYDELKAGK